MLILGSKGMLGKEKDNTRVKGSMGGGRGGCVRRGGKEEKEKKLKND